MSMSDKARHSADEWVGKGKEAAGKATGDEELEREGRVDQAKAHVEKAGDALKDAFHKATGRD